MRTMKIRSLIHIAVLGIVALIVIPGCETMEDTYSQFSKVGETLYIAKADSIKVRGGNYRIELSWLLLSDPKIHSYKVYWNNRRDSIANSVVKTEGVDTVRLLLTNMREDVHNFDIYTFDKHGNSSVRASTVGRVYGDNYKGGLLNRTYKSLTRKGSDVIVQWSASDNTVLHVELNYLNSENMMVSKRIPRSVEKDTLLKFPTGGTFNYRTVFLPEPAALDIFYSSERSVTF